jgi:hypothetical protein
MKVSLISYIYVLKPIIIAFLPKKLIRSFHYKKDVEELKTSGNNVFEKK